jgi:hypothetical protein
MKKVLLLLLAIALYCVAIFAKNVKETELTQKVLTVPSSQNSIAKTFN